ncbi:MAG: AMP-binding protein [Deltaproteobacteria bacterium]
MRAADWLAGQARRRPLHPALILDEGAVIDFATLEHETALLAARLRRAGVVHGTTILSLLRPGLAFVSLLHAMPRLGATLAVANAGATVAEIARIATLATPVLVVAEAAERALGRAAAGVADTPLVLVAKGSLVLADTDPGEPLDPTLDHEKPHTLLFTSGTSGAPKGILHSSGNFLATAISGAVRLGSRPNDAWLAAMPLHHMGGIAILMRSIILGTTVVLHASFDASRVAEVVLAGEVTQISLVPTMLDRLVDALGGRRPPATLRFVLVGGAQASASGLARAQAAGLPVAPSFGMTETTSQVATAKPRRRAFATGEVGHALENTEIRLVDAERRPVETGSGAIELRGTSIALGRLVAPGQVVSLVDADGWMTTNDAGEFDQGRVLRVLGRIDEVIVTGGENVAPGEVEAALADHPSILEVGVVGRPDAVWGMAVTAFVVLRPGRQLSLGELRAHAATRLARYKLPQALERVAALPRTAAGKLRRRDLL